MSHIVLKNQALIRQLRGPIFVLPLPALSPTMKEGVISKFYQNEGGKIKSNSLIMDLNVPSLVESDRDKIFNMEIELQDELYLSKIIKPLGLSITVDEIVAILCEDEKDLETSANFNISESSEVAQYGGKVRVAVWQAYVKNKEDSNTCG